MGGSSGSGNSTVTNRTEVDPVTQQWRQQILNAGGELYNRGTQNYYPNQTVVPFSNQTQSGMNYLQQQAQQGAPNLQAANDSAGRALSGWNPAMPYAANAAAGGLSNNPANQALSQYGTGNNQYAQGLFNQASQDVGNAVNAQFAQAGRYGGNAAHTGEMYRQQGNLYNQMMTPLAEAERNRGLTAQQTMGSLYDSGQNRALQGADLFGSMYSQGNTDAMRQQGLMGSLYSYGQMPGQAMLDIGGMYEGQAQNYINDDRARYEYQSQAPWGNLERYAGLMGALPSTQNSTQNNQVPGPNRLMTTAGGAMSGAAMGTSIMPGWGTAIGAIAGGLYGAVGGSDIRIKKNIEFVGQDERGHRWYDFHYINDDEREPKWRGVMAQEAALIAPEAVSMHPLGFYCVNYGAL